MTAPDDEVRWQRLTVVLRAADHAGHHKLATELLDRARKAHLKGATLLEGERSPAPAGTHRLRREDVPLRLCVVEEADTLARFLEDNVALLRDVVVVLEGVTAFRA